MIVTRCFYAPLLLVLLGVAPVADALDEPYNAGVAACKKKDYAQAANQWSQAVLVFDEAAKAAARQWHFISRCGPASRKEFVFL